MHVARSAHLLANNSHAWHNTAPPPRNLPEGQERMGHQEDGRTGLLDWILGAVARAVRNTGSRLARLFTWLFGGAPSAAPGAAPTPVHGAAGSQHSWGGALGLVLVVAAAVVVVVAALARAAARK